MFFFISFCFCNSLLKFFSPPKVGCSKFYAFFAYSIYAFDYQIRRKVFNRPFLNMAVSSILQPFFEFEINSSVLIG